MGMRYIAFLEPPTEKFIESFIRENKLAGKYLNPPHPQEDFFCVSKKYPIFAVADGVTLIQFLLEGKDYPNPSPAGDVARIFCEEAIKTAETFYESFDEADMKKVFEAGNNAVGEYNRMHNRTKENVDYWNNDFYAITAAIAVIKENKLYWGSICDSFVARFNSAGELLFQSPDCGALAQASAPPFSEDVNDQKARAQYLWRVKRNGVNEKGERIGYGVITGEKEALMYLSQGKYSVKSGDIFAVFTDGFQEYMKLPEFVSLLSKRSTDIELHIRKFTAIKAKENPKRFGHERTLIAITL